MPQYIFLSLAIYKDRYQIFHMEIKAKEIVILKFEGSFHRNPFIQWIESIPYNYVLDSSMNKNIMKF